MKSGKAAEKQQITSHSSSIKLTQKSTKTTITNNNRQPNESFRYLSCLYEQENEENRFDDEKPTSTPLIEREIQVANEVSFY